MKNVFLSYALEDCVTAARVAAAFESCGLCVWWDRHIQVGQNWQRSINENLNQSQSVVVLWSANAIASDYVLEQATFARDRKKLAAARIDNTEIPVGFRLIQTADLTAWQGDGPHPEFDKLEAGIRAIVSVPSLQVTPPAAPPEPSVVRRMVWLALPTAAAAAIVGLLMILHAPAYLEGEVLARRIAFRTTAEKQTIIEHLPVKMLGLTGFDEIRAGGARIWLADPSQYDSTRDAYPESAWKAIPPMTALRLLPSESSPATAVIRGLTAFDLSRLESAPSVIVMNSPTAGTLQVEVGTSPALAPSQCRRNFACPSGMPGSMASTWLRLSPFA